VSRQVPIIAYIRDNATGEVVEDRSDCNAFPDGAPNPFWWQRDMGNAGCDCNRKIFFHRRKGVEPEDEETPCGDSAFDVNLATLDGNVFYREFAS
jgi:hypothetical protein